MSAEVLQEQLESVKTEVDSEQFLTFMLAGEEYGVDILRVQEIRGWEHATDIPRTPDYIKGVINLRGAVVPIIDLRQRFGLDSVEYCNTTVVIVLKISGVDKDRIMGFVVDAVSDVYNITQDQFKDPPDFGEQASTDFVKGLATVSGKMVILLDIDQLVDERVLTTVSNTN